ncbi:MAG: hypothetical protein ACOY9J_08675 [Pseudomonadota bacterium]
MAEQQPKQSGPTLSAQMGAIVYLCVVAYVLGGAFCLGVKTINLMVPTESVRVVINGQEYTPQ